MLVFQGMKNDTRSLIFDCTTSNVRSSTASESWKPASNKVPTNEMSVNTVDIGLSNPEEIPSQHAISRHHMGIESLVV